MGDRWRSRDSRDRGGGGGRYEWSINKHRKAHKPVVDLVEVDGTVKIWIGGLPGGCTDRRVRDLCSKFGTVISAAIRTSANDTYAFVDFARMRDAKDAVDALDQAAPFGEAKIKVAPALRKGQKGGGKGGGGYHHDWNRGGDWHRGGDRRRSASRRRSRSPRRRTPPRRSRSRRRSPSKRRSRSRSRRRSRTRSKSRRRSRSRSRGGSAPRRGGGGEGARGGGASPRERRASPPAQRRRSPSDDVELGKKRSPSAGRQSDDDEDEAPASPPPSRCWRVVLSQLPVDMEDEELKDFAAEYGTILAHELHKEGSYKAGWVEYKQKPEAEKAVKALNNRRMMDWSLRLQAYLYPGGSGMGGGIATK